MHTEQASPGNNWVWWMTSVGKFFQMRGPSGLVSIALLVMGAGALVVALPLERSIHLIGNASFAASFLSYAQSDMIKLRLIAIVSLCMGLIYNTYTHLQMPEGQGIALVIFWLSVFLMQNIFKALSEVSQSIEAPLDAGERQLMVAGFPTMHSKDWELLAKHAQKWSLSKGEVILNAGDETTTLLLLAAGKAMETRMDSISSLVRQPGTFWGELTWTLGKGRFDKSPCSVVVTSESAQLWHWDYETLDELTRKNPRMLASLRDGFLRSACFKHGLLKPRENDTDPIWGEQTLTMATN